MLTLAKPKLKPGNHATLNRAQYTVTHGYINGLGLPIAVVDRRGCSIIINPSSNMGYTGKLVITIYHTYAGPCQMNTLDSIQHSPELAKLWGDEHQGIKRDFIYSYELGYEDVAKKGWNYIDELDVVVTTDFLSPSNVRHPREVQEPSELLGATKRRQALEIWLSGLDADARRFIKVAGQTMMIPGNGTAGEVILNISANSYAETPNAIKVSDPESLKYIVFINQEYADDLEGTARFRNKVLELAQKEVERRGKQLDRAVDAIIEAATEAVKDIDRSLDRYDRVVKSQIDEGSLRRKASVESLKYVNPLSGLLVDILG